MNWQCLQGDAETMLRTIPSGTVKSCVSSPPYYGMRDYLVDEQIGRESTPTLYVNRMVNVFREVRRVLTDDGTLWLNIGDSYATVGGDGQQGKTGQRANRRFTAEGTNRKGHGDAKPKDLIGIPWMIAFALRADGWYLRQDIIWDKPNPMPESVTDRCTKAHEYVFLLTKSARYYFDAEAIAERSNESLGDAKQTGQHKQTALGQNATGTLGRNYGQPRKRPGGGASFGKQKHDTNGTGQQSRIYERPEYLTRNARSVWRIPTKSYHGAHFAVMPEALALRCIKAGSREGDTVLDPFAGSGTTLKVAVEMGRKAIGIELSQAYIDGPMAERMAGIPVTLFDAVGAA